MLIGFVGDMLVHRDHPSEVFREVRDLLAVPEVLFGNIEGMYSDHPHPSPNAYIVVGAPAHNLDVYSEVGFSVLSLASNHVLDMGYDAMLETRARLRVQNIKTCGVGDCLPDAREPAIVEAGDLRVAFLGYASVFPDGYEARSNAPGLAPMRPDQSDFEHLQDDIRRAKSRADLVITSFHWGDYSRPFHLTDHETRTARYAIERGADMVIGHHHHALRGMEWYQGKPIMYGLGQFVYDLRTSFGEEVKKSFITPDQEDTSYGVGPRKGWPLLPLHKDTRMTVLAWAEADRLGIHSIGFLPCRLTPDGLVHPLSIGSAEGQEVVNYLQQCNKTQNLTGEIIEGKCWRDGFRCMRVVSSSG